MQFQIAELSKFRLGRVVYVKIGSGITNFFIKTKKTAPQTVDKTFILSSISFYQDLVPIMLFPLQLNLSISSLKISLKSYAQIWCLVCKNILYYITLLIRQYVVIFLGVVTIKVPVIFPTLEIHIKRYLLLFSFIKSQYLLSVNVNWPVVKGLLNTF